MSIFDGDGENFNIRFPTMGGKVFWEELEARDGYRLQQNRVDKHCRILDGKDQRVAWGEEGAMRAKLRQLTERSSALRAKYGDVIGVHRIGGLYDHYGVFESVDRVYEYAAATGDMGDPEVRVSTLKKFLGDQDAYFVLVFPESRGRPGKLPVPVSAAGQCFGLGGVPGAALLEALEILRRLEASGDYHLYSPEETIQRARSRLGEHAYNLALNNCEHFALWCKTGIRQSHQVEGLLKGLERRDMRL